MGAFSTGFVLTILAVLSIAFAVDQKPLDPKAIYQGCGTPDRKCVGDEDGCITNMNCTFVAAVQHATNSFQAEIQNNCNGETDSNVFLAIGALGVLSGYQGSTVKVTCVPAFEDFKFFILWSGKEKCPKHGLTEKKWSSVPKSNQIPLCPRADKIDDLVNFTKHNILVQAGEGNVELLTKNAKEVSPDLYLNDPTKEPVPNADENNSGTTVLTTINMLLFTLVSTYLIR